MPNGDRFLQETERLCRRVEGMRFAAPVALVYNPLRYARAAYSAYVQRYGDGPRRLLFVGMNPGPWGMAQTGIPFGEISAVRDWIGINEPVARPEVEHPKRLIEGFSCSRSEVSGRRLWALMRQRFTTAARFFEHQFVANYCPLVFMESSGRNRTPDKLPKSEREPLFAACDDYLAATIELLQPQFVVGIGGFARARVDAVLQRVSPAPRALTILHPSPANPRANRDWSGEVTAVLEAAGAWQREHRR